MEAIEELLVEDMSITKFIKQFKDNEQFANFDSQNRLIGMCECLERVQREFWGRDPDPLDERSPRMIPLAGIYADICNDLISNRDFIFDLIMKFITAGINNQNDCTRHMLRLLCSVLNCCSLSIIFSEFNGDRNDNFYNKIFEWAMGEDMSNNVYSTYILGHITKEDDQVIPQRKASYIQLIEVTMSRLWTLRYMPKSKIFGEWNLSSPMHKTMQARLLIYFLRHIAEFETMMTTMYNGGVLSLMSFWLRVDRHGDIRLTFEALRLLTKLLRHRLIRTKFNDSMNGIQLLLNIPRPSVAANAVTFCLYNLLCYDEIVDKVIRLSPQKLNKLINMILDVIATCHPFARCYGMLCFQCLIGKPINLKNFNNLDGPSYILTSLNTMRPIYKSPKISMKFNDHTYFALLKTTLNTMKISLEKSLISWSMEVENSDATGLLAFPSESEIPFSKAAVNAIPLAMKRQTWKHPYISDSNKTIRKIYNTFGFFNNSFCNYKEIINSSLDILSLLCISNKFVHNFLNYTTETVVCIFLNIIRKPRTSIIRYVKALESILFFLSILYCRPVQDGEMWQSKLWWLAQNNKVIPKLLKVLEKSLSLSNGVSVRTWVCHVMLGLSQHIVFLRMLKNEPIFSREVFNKYVLKKVTPEQMGEHTEFVSIAQQLLQALYGKSYTWFDEMPEQTVDQTLVPLDRRELLGIIHQHLQNEGLNEVADQLRREGNLSVSDPSGNISVYEDTAMAGSMSKLKLCRGSIHQTSPMVCSVPPPKPGNSTTLEYIVDSFRRIQQGKK